MRDEVEGTRDALLERMTRRTHLSLRIVALTLLVAAAAWPRTQSHAAAQTRAAPQRPVALTLADRR